LVTRTIDDLYYTLTVTRFELPPLVLTKALLLGLGASVVAALLPAREATAAPPGVALSRAQLEARWQAALPRFSLAGLALVLTGALVLWFSDGLVGGFAGLFALVIGCALLCPVALVGMAALAARLPGGELWRMAVRGTVRQLSRTGVAAAALAVAFSATVGVGVMVDSFRSGVIVWLEDLLTADFYIAPIEEGSIDRTLDPAVLERLPGISGVAAVATARWREVWLRGRPTDLSAMRLPPVARAGYRFRSGEPAAAWRGFDAGAVLVSEPLAYRHGLAPGDAITLSTDRGPVNFPIAAVFYDYGSEHGRILLAAEHYRRHWDDPARDSAAVFAAADADRADLRETLQRALGPLQPLRIRSDGELYRLTLEVFDRTFTITGVLRLLAIAVAAVGLVSALLAQLLERAREFSVLRALGLTPRGLGGLLALQSGLLGLAAGLLALPLGLLLAAVLIFVINRRAFGWTLPFEVDPMILLHTVGLAVVAALLAVLVPLWRLRRLEPAEGLRAE
ncbi:MAG: ABC transporter permease, partial [Candidatus Competibacterales bacterium]|nr:ABC transporter permease [Candidatus Competibacterales bacterium]